MSEHSNPSAQAKRPMKRGFIKWKKNPVPSRYALWTASRRGSSVHDRRSRQFSRFAGHLHFGTNSIERGAAHRGVHC